jgi:solute carrier family 25 carnitine/acylcarnitine transporter 20/29
MINDNLNISQPVINILASMTQATIVTGVGHPLDSIKSRLQTNQYPNTFTCLKQTITHEGVKGLYKGISMPFIAHLLKRPIQHPCAEYMKSKLMSNPNIKMNKLHNYAIGGLSGMLIPIIGTPLQVIKISVQTANNKKISNSYDYIKYNYQKNGLIGFYRGFICNIMRDGVYSASFVGNYYTMRDTFGSDTLLQNFINGATSHCLTVFIFIPMDYIKTNIQQSEKK